MRHLYTVLMAVGVGLVALGVLRWVGGGATSDEEVIARFVELWNERLGIHEQSRWLGIETLQNPLDVWVTQEIIHEVKPDVIVETGTWRGGSAVLWAMVLQEVNPEGRILTVDLDDHVEEARELPIWQRKVDQLVGSSTDPAIVEAVREGVEGKRTLFILDSLHTRDHVLAELRAYAPLVSVGSYVIVQDTGVWQPIRGREGGWASDAVAEFVAEDDRFVVDAEKERFLITNNPTGFLQRVR